MALSFYKVAVGVEQDNQRRTLQVTTLSGSVTQAEAEAVRSVYPARVLEIGPVVPLPPREGLSEVIAELSRQFAGLTREEAEALKEELRRALSEQIKHLEAGHDLLSGL